MKFRSILLAAGLLSALAMSAQAQQQTQTQGDPARGQVLAYTCHGCHGIPNYKNVYPTYAVPKLGGQSPAYIFAALKAYATQQRSHPTMYSQSATMSDQDMRDIAAFFGSQPIRPGNPVAGTPPPSTATCVACHGNDGVGITPDYPTLSGQYADYLAQSLRDYKSGKRKNPIMVGFTTALTDEDIEAIANFFSVQRGLCGTEVVAKNNGQCQ